MSADATTRPGFRPSLPTLAVAAVLGAIVVLLATMASGLMANRTASAPSVQSSGAALPAATPCSVCGMVVAIRSYALRDDGSVSGADSSSGVKQVYRESVETLFGAEPAGQLVYRVTVRMDDGSFRTLSQRGVPEFRTGLRVKVLNGAISPRT